MNLNTSYLNKTPNKTKRLTTDFKPLFVVCHETAGTGSLDWNLRPDVQASFNYLIKRDGEIYHYVDERTHFAWHAGRGPNKKPYNGNSRILINNTLYTGSQVNIYAIGVELEGPNDGTSITSVQTKAMLDLLHYFNTTYGIPLTREYIVSHKDVAPGYKSDPQGYSVQSLLSQLTLDPVVIGTAPSISQAQFIASIKRHTGAMSAIELMHLYTLLVWLEIEPSFFIALWHAEDATFGRSDLQAQSHMPINIKAALGEWRPTIKYNGERWLSAESLQLGAMMSILHLKNVHGAAGRYTVRQIITEHAPASDGNNPEQIIKNILEDMAYIRSH